jgi:secreted PhoX family phosphatase
MVWGQYGSFFTNTANNPTVPAALSGVCPAPSPASACTLRRPERAIADSQGNLYVSDTVNSRVLEYDNALSTGTINYRQNATMVYGQAGNFTTNCPNQPGVTACSVSPPPPTATSFYSPGGLGLDSAGNLWVTDQLNNRVLEFSPAVTGNRTSATNPIWVLGQRGSFTSGPVNAGGLDQGSLDFPTSIAFDGDGNVYVTDYSNSRILQFDQPYPISARIGLAQGWNLISLPSQTALPYTASMALDQINQEGGHATMVAVYGNGRYTVFVPGFGSDFALAPKQGFWVLTSTSSVWTLT